MPPESKIKHFFVLMLENRSYDHLLGYANLVGKAPGSPASAAPLEAEGLVGAESNPGADGQLIHVSPTAPDSIGFDPVHEFPDIRTQLCGIKGAYPDITLQGFVRAQTKPDGPRVMDCFDPARIPVLTTLAREFAVCDHWHSALPGPTWPNRLFAMAATSGGLFCSPNTAATLWETTFGHYKFQNGDIFSNLTKQGKAWRVYHQGIPLALTLDGMAWDYFFSDKFRDFSHFSDDLQDGYGPQFTFIEPHYGGIADSSYTEGNSQHPNGNIQDGERLIRDVYTALRKSPLWPESMLLITYDEHGGFFDHVQPTPAVPPGDKPNYSGQNGKGLDFDFTLSGVRVPAVVISAWTPKGTVVQDVLDHGSISKTVAELFEVDTLTQRDKAAKGLAFLACLDQPRTSEADARLSVDPAAPLEKAISVHVPASQDEALRLWSQAQPTEGLGKLLLELGTHVGLQLKDLDSANPPDQKTFTVKSVTQQNVTDETQKCLTRYDAGKYLQDVHKKVLDFRAGQAKAPQ